MRKNRRASFLPIVILLLSIMKGASGDVSRYPSGVILRILTTYDQQVSNADKSQHAVATMLESSK